MMQWKRKVVVAVLAVTTLFDAAGAIAYDKFIHKACGGRNELYAAPGHTMASCMAMCSINSDCISFE